MFEQVVLAGGGHRCWWQAGFWDVVAPRIALRPKVIAGVSAGAGIACLLYANDSREAIRFCYRTMSSNPKNAYWLNLLRPGERVFPQYAIYRSALKTLLGGVHFNQLQRNAPEIRVVYARIPRHLEFRSAAMLGMVADQFDKYGKKTLHPEFATRLGFTTEVELVKDCPNDDDLVSLILASSCTPPFTPVVYRRGGPVLDGGLVDSIPVAAVDPAPVPTLVLTTRRYPGYAQIFGLQGRIYVQPSRQIPVSSWDYTAPDRIEQTFVLGREDGETFLRAIGRGALERAQREVPGDNGASDQQS